MVTGTKGSLLDLKRQLESVYPIKASIIGAGSTKSIKALNPDDMLVRNRDTVSTRSPTLDDDVNDENPVWLDPEQISKYRSHVARCLFLSQDKANINIRRDRAVPENVRSFKTVFPNGSDSFGT